MGGSGGEGGCRWVYGVDACGRVDGGESVELFGRMIVFEFGYGVCLGLSWMQLAASIAFGRRRHIHRGKVEQLAPTMDPSTCSLASMSLVRSHGYLKSAIFRVQRKPEYNGV